MKTIYINQLRCYSFSHAESFNIMLNIVLKYFIIFNKNLPQEIFLHVIPVRIIVSCSHKTFCLPFLKSNKLLSLQSHNKRLCHVPMVTETLFCSMMTNKVNLV